MSIGSFSQDPVFKAFSNATGKLSSGDGLADPGGSSTDNSSITAISSSVPDNHNFPTGSRLFSYMQPGQLSRKSSHSSTEAKSAFAASPASPPRILSSMSPYANAFQPSSSKHVVKPSSYEPTKNRPPFEQEFADALTFSDYGHQQANFGNCGNTQEFTPGNLPTPPNSSGGRNATAGDPIGSHQPFSKSPAVAGASVIPSNIAVESIRGTTYFYKTPPFDARHAQASQEIHSHDDQPMGDMNTYQMMPDVFMYNGPLSNVAHFKPRDGMGFASYFAPDEIKTEMIHRQVLCMAEADPKVSPELPQEVGCYHKVVPLEHSPTGLMAQRSGYFGAITSVYKANSTKTGLTYCLYRIHNYRLVNARCLSVIEAWKKLQHSNIVQIREVFTTKAFGDNSVIFVYDYWPSSETVKTRHFGGSAATINGFGASSHGDEMDLHAGSHARASGSKGIGGSRPTHGTGGLLPEAFIWCYVIQLSSALRQIHSVGLSSRTIDPSKLIVMGRSRLMINCCGILDVLAFDELQQPTMMQHFQQEDLTNFGRVVLALACNNPMVALQREQWQSSVEFVSHHYSPDLKNLILYLTAAQRLRNVNDIMPMIGARFYSQLETSQNRVDMLENELTKEISNGRLFRLLCKLGAVNERPEFAMDPQWSETGDRFLLKLFRDYLFHQVTEDGRPWLDIAHTVQCLNKLDAGVDEKIALSSRDQQNVLIVSYAELHRCLDQAFGELLRH